MNGATLSELIWKFSADGWSDIAHLGDADLVEYLFRISNGSFWTVLPQIPLVRLAALAPRLDTLIAASTKGGWYHQLLNETNGVREGRIRAAVATAAATPIPQAPSSEPTLETATATATPTTDPAASGQRSSVELRELEGQFTLLLRQLKDEFELLRVTRGQFAVERVAGDAEFRRQLVRGVLGLMFLAGGGLLAIFGLRS